jgi:hypothetical protein
VPSVVGPFMAPNEQMRKKEGPYLTWYTTGGGIYAYAFTAMFVQVYDEHGAILLPALPSRLSDLRFRGLLATDGVRVSGELKGGRITGLSLDSEKAMAWRFRMPRERLSAGSFRTDLDISAPDERGLVAVSCRLQPGTTPLVR